MALDQAGVEALQNSTQTDWSQFDRQLADRSDADQNRFAADHKLHVRFYMKARLNPNKSAEQNRPVYEDTEYIEIMMPGEKNNIIQRPAWSQDYARFPKHYEQFKAGLKDQMVGTPLKVLPFLTEAQVEELAYFKIRTVEQLSEMSDAVMQNFMGARELQQKAKKWLEGTRSAESLLAKSEEQGKLIENLQRELQALKQQQKK